MKKNLMVLGGGLGMLIMLGSILGAVNSKPVQDDSGNRAQPERPSQNFDIEILVDGRPLDEYFARGRSYVEAIQGAEYEVRIHNPLPYRVAVALSVDGLNTIDARRTNAWNASKWVIEPYGTISVEGWQMSSQRARRFYFTSEQDSYGAKLGQTANLGVISAVFFRERQPIVVPIAPPPYPRPQSDDKERIERSTSGQADGTLQRAPRSDSSAAMRDEEYAATGIGRSVRNDVRWVQMDLDSRPAAEVSIRYEYYSALVRLGIVPRRIYRPDPLKRRESARGFEDRRFSPEP